GSRVALGCADSGGDAAADDGLALTTGEDVSSEHAASSRVPANAARRMGRVVGRAPIESATLKGAMVCERHLDRCYDREDVRTNPSSPHPDADRCPALVRLGL